MKKKAWWKSKTILINVGIGIVTALEMRLDLLQPLLSLNLYSILALALVIANVILRSTTYHRISTRSVDHGDR